MSHAVELPNRPPYVLAPEDAAKLPSFRKSEEHRHQCEARLVLDRRNKDGNWDWAETYFVMVEKKRGTEARDRLANSVKQQWRLGNRGAFEDWRDVAQPQVSTG